MLLKCALLTWQALASPIANRNTKSCWLAHASKATEGGGVAQASPRTGSENKDTICQWVTANQRVHKQPVELHNPPASLWSACLHLSSKDWKYLVVHKCKPFQLLQTFSSSCHIKTWTVRNTRNNREIFNTLLCPMTKKRPSYITSDLSVF